jgi:ATP-binding cassette subfamily B protein
MNSRQSSSWILLKRFISEAFTHRKLLLIIALSIAGSTISTLAAPYILGVAIDKYIVPRNI